MEDLNSNASDPEIISRVLAGEPESFEILIQRHQQRIFALARRYARMESEVEDIVQEVFVKAFRKLSGWRGDAPFEHWLCRLAVRTCYDFLRAHQRNREQSFSELGSEDGQWIERVASGGEPAVSDSESGEAAHDLIWKALEQLSPAARLVLTLLEIEDKSVKEIATLTGWSVPLVKVRAFRARLELRKVLERMPKAKYL